MIPDPALFKPGLPEPPPGGNFALAPGGLSYRDNLQLVRKLLNSMVAVSIGKWRVRLGALLVALYALSLLTPAASFAVTGGAPCLAEHAAPGSGAAHHHGAGHAPADHDRHAGLPCKCCTLFCVTAIAPAPPVLTVRPVAIARLVSQSAESVGGRGFDRIDRPPRPSLSL